MQTNDENQKEKITFKLILKDFFNKHKSVCITYLILSCMFPLKNVVIPHYIGKLTKAISNKQNVLRNCFIILAFVVFLQIINIFLELVDVKIFPIMQLHIRDLFLSRIFESTANNYSEVENSNIISQVIRFPYVFYGHITSWIENYIPAIVTVIATSIYLMFVCPLIGIVFILVFTIIIYIFHVSFKGCKRISEKRDSYLNKLFSQIDDTMNNIKTVLSFNMQQQEIDNINSSHPEYAALSHKSVVCSIRNKYLVLTLYAYIVFLTLCVYFTKIKIFGFKVNIDKSTFISISIILYTIFTLLERINYQFKDTIFKWGTIENILKTFNNSFIYKPDKKIVVVEEEEDNSPSLDERGIRFSNVTFRIEDNTIIDNISVIIPYKKKTLIIGEIGSGKTTLINLIMKYYIPDSGNIYLNGMSYKNLNMYNLRNVIGYLPQNPILFNRSIFKNIAFGIQDITKEKIIDKMNDLGIGNFFDNFPNGIDTEVGINGSNLSGGQKQIIWIIKIALLDPEYILLDEPTASLDPETKKIIYTLIRKLIKDKTVVMITHDEYLYDIADHIIRLDNGRVIST